MNIPEIRDRTLESALIVALQGFSFYVYYHSTSIRIEERSL